MTATLVHLVMKNCPIFDPLHFITMGHQDWAQHLFYWIGSPLPIDMIKIYHKELVVARCGAIYASIWSAYTNCYSANDLVLLYIIG